MAMQVSLAVTDCTEWKHLTIASPLTDVFENSTILYMMYSRDVDVCLIKMQDHERNSAPRTAKNWRRGEAGETGQDQDPPK